MENNQLQLVTFEQAQRLKKSGFDWHTTDNYTPSGKSEDCFMYDQGYPDNWNGCSTDGWCSAPTVALALKWMRDVKGFAFYVRCEHEWETNSERVYFDPVSWYGEYENSGAISNTDTVNTYESAESALLEELLTLIEK